MTFSLITNTGKTGASSSTVTTNAVDTTGANLIVVAVGSYDGLTAEALTDSKGNTWTALTAYRRVGDDRVRLYYCYGPTVGSGHTFTFAATNSFSSIAVQAWSGAASSPHDQENGANAAASTIATGSVTPSENDEILVSAAVNEAGTISSIDSSFTTSNLQAAAGGLAYGVGMAYKIQTTAGAENPTWTLPSSQKTAATISTFKAAGAPPTGGGMIVGPGPLVGGGMLVGGGPIVSAAA